MTFSPFIDPQLVELVEQLDDEKRPIAAIWRELGHIARRRLLLQPSYESVRKLVHLGRALRRLRRMRSTPAAVTLFRTAPKIPRALREREFVTRFSRRL